MIGWEDDATAGVVGRIKSLHRCNNDTKPAFAGYRPPPIPTPPMRETDLSVAGAAPRPLSRPEAEVWSLACAEPALHRCFGRGFPSW